MKRNALCMVGQKNGNQYCIACVARACATSGRVGYVFTQPLQDGTSGAL